MKVATVFSGIGAFEMALQKQNIQHEIVFACDNGERYIDNDILECEDIENAYATHSQKNYVQQMYQLNYGNDFPFYQDIRCIDGTKYANEIDIFVGGSPCQSFSVIGHRAGLNDTRGTLFYEYARLVKEIKPKIFIFENVTGMLSHDKGNTWKIIHEVFEDLGYSWKYKILNSMDYGVPQNRKRLFVIGFKSENKFNKFEFPIPFDLRKNMTDFLESSYDKKYFLPEKGFKFVTNPKYRGRAHVDKEITMCQKANQQFNWNGDFVFVNKENIPFNVDSLYLDFYNNQEGAIRKLTPRECFNLMGFPDYFKIDNEIPDKYLYRQSGNSIVVNVFEELLKELNL